MAETMSEYYARKAREEAAMREAIHHRTMVSRKAYMDNSPGSYSPWEKQAADNYFREREQQRQFDESQQTARGQWGYTEADGTHHAGGAEKVAEYDWMGKRDAGMGAAGLTAEATKHTADKNFEGIEKQAQNALELEREKQKFLDIVNGRDNATKIRQSEIEWGIHKPDGTYTPGGRVAQAQAQGEAAAKIAEQNNQARIEQERIKAQAKTTAAAMAKDTRIAAAIGGNPMLANNPGKAQEMLEALAGAGLSAEEAAEIIERRNKQQSGQGTGTAQQPAENARTQKIRNTYQQRGIGV